MKQKPRVKLTNAEAFNFFDEKYAIVLNGGQISLLDKKSPELQFLRIEDVKKFFSYLVMDGFDKNPLAFDYWLNHAAAERYCGVVFMPTTGNHEQLRSPLKPGPLNLWRGFSCEPKLGSCGRFLDHVHDVICRQDDDLYNYTIAWLANLFKEPLNRPGVAIVLRGGQGTGKGVFARAIGKLFNSAHFIHFARPELIVGRFNSHYAGKILVFVDEAFYAGGRDAAGILKALITEDELTVEPKGKAPFTIQNYARFIIASNERWVVPVDLDDRRFLFLDVSHRRQKDFEYFGKIEDELTNGGYEALLYYLLNEVKLDRVNLRTIPSTAGLISQKLESADTIFSFWYEEIADGRFFEKQESKGCVEKKVIHGAYKEGAKARTKWPADRTYFWKRTNEVIGKVENGPYKKVGKMRVRTVRLPEITAAREQIHRLLGINSDS